MPYDAADPRQELLQLLSQQEIPFSDTIEEVRFVLCEGGCQWEVICRFASQIVMLYSVYPFLVHDRVRALEAANEVAAQLQQGGLFLADDRLVLRMSAVLSDVYLAQEILAHTLEYSASVMRYFWETMRRCAE
jgi:hypothetical protein